MILFRLLTKSKIIREYLSKSPLKETLVVIFMLRTNQKTKQMKFVNIEDLLTEKIKRGSVYLYLLSVKT